MATLTIMFLLSPLRVEVKWEFPRMAALPLEAFTEEDPPVEDPAFYYPPGRSQSHCSRA